MSSDAMQNPLRLAWGVHNAPADAPRKLVLACLQYEREAANKALAVSMLAGGHKLAYMAAHTGLSESYISLLRNGKRPVTNALVSRLCAATGSNLVAQVWEAAAAMDENDDRREEERLAAMLRAAA